MRLADKVAIITGGGSGIGNNKWNLDLELFEDNQLEEWVVKIKGFLQNWGVPPDTYFTIYPDDWKEGMESRRVEVFDK